MSSHFDNGPQQSEGGLQDCASVAFFQEGISMSTASLGRSSGVAPRQHEEGEITKQIEHYTSQVPSGVYLSLAIGSIGLSAVLHMVGRKQDAQFVGHWVPTILLLGLYNKLVKLEGSD